MRLQVGAQAPHFSAHSMKGDALSLDSYRGHQVLLQFYRFAGCPPCNLHVREFMRRYDELQALDINVIAFFHSPRASLEKQMDDVEFPFAIVPDPDKKIFHQYGVETSMRGLLTRQSLKETWKAARAGFAPNPLLQEGGLDGLPANFLIDQAGLIWHAHYGRDAVDTLPVDRVLELVRAKARLPLSG